MKTFTIIATVDVNDGMGYGGKLPWSRVDHDFKHLHERITHSADGKCNAIVMGRKTYLSLSNSLPKNHRAIVISRTLNKEEHRDIFIAPNLNEAIELSCSPDIDQVFVVGGGQVFSSAIRDERCSGIDLTRIHDLFTCDIFFPDIPEYARVKRRIVGRIDEKILISNEFFARKRGSSSYNEDSYLRLVRQVLESGIERSDRTGVGTLSIFGPQIRFKLDRYPLLTSKKMFFKGIAEELFWFISGSTDAKKLSEKGVNIWDGNGSRAFLDQQGFREREEGDLGPCFVAGTKVLTYDGYKNIEDVKEDDLLFSHLGNWQPIKEIQTRSYTGLLIEVKAKYLAHSILATPEHPFFARTFRIKDRYKGKRNAVLLDDPQWMKAEDIRKKDCFLGFKIEETERIPEFLLYKCKEQIWYAKKLDRLEEWFMMGYFLGDGWVVDEKNGPRIFFAINKKQERNIVSKLRLVLNIQCCERVDNCAKYRCCNIEYATILKMFGKYAHGKKIPNWVHKAPKKLIEYFLDGYRSADGCIEERIGCYRQRYTTVSDDIAHSVQRLYMKLGRFAGSSFHKRGYKKEIKPGKLSHCRDCYSISISNRNHSRSFIENGYAWLAIGNISEKYVEDTQVFNFEVDEDNSYTVGNLSVHNCYGHQWRRFGSKYIDSKTDYSGQGVDQLVDVMRLIKEDPTSRRIIMSAWNPADLKLMALPPCHILCQFYVEGKNLSCHLYQRSADIGLGLPFNIASYALLTYLIAHFSGLSPKELIISLGDAHIYRTHISALQEQVDKRKTYPFPQLKIIGYPKDIFSVKYENLKLIDYLHEPALKMRMAV